MMNECDIIEAHCYFVDIGRTDREQIRSRINVRQNVLQSLLLILLRICSRSVRPMNECIMMHLPSVVRMSWCTLSKVSKDVSVSKCVRVLTLLFV